MTGRDLELRTEREVHYGAPRNCHENIGRTWGALLDHAGWQGGPVPPHLVAAMMAALKLVRGITAGGEFSQDSFDDGRVYLGFAAEFHPKRRP
jgi:hypothetical protein